ncbi:MAG: hypothetical protein PWQ91_1454 [Eubacteriales bacterium]|nr:hypothetical protein [Eubacteriales bacterium]MDN5364392.1 hypothetical protein [Eubacteriales bacterium]
MSYQLFHSREYCAVTFPSTHHALKAEKVLEAAGVDFLIIPVPRHISASCGLAVKIFCSARDEVSRILQEAGVVVEGIYEVRRQEGDDV